MLHCRKVCIKLPLGLLGSSRRPSDHRSTSVKEAPVGMQYVTCRGMGQKMRLSGTLSRRPRGGQSHWSKPGAWRSFETALAGSLHPVPPVQDDASDFREPMDQGQDCQGESSGVVTGFPCLVEWPRRTVARSRLKTKSGACMRACIIPMKSDSVRIRVRIIATAAGPHDRTHWRHR